MATEAVKRQILLAVDALTIPQNRVPSSTSIGEACAAAKLLRNRLLREHTRVTEQIEALRERQLYDEVSDYDVNYDDDDAEVRLAGGDVSRSEFVFVCEMMVAEKLVIPLLLAHGMNFGDTLLPQLLKLLAVMLLPVPRYSANEVLQKDLLQKIKTRCGTDEFFALLVQCVAPIAEKRTSGDLQRDDVVILEIVLTLIAHLLDGSPPETERIIGAFCRNHGVELLLVVINQNYSRVQSTSAAQLAAAPDHHTDNHADNTQPGEQAAAIGSSVPLAEEEVDLESDGVESQIDLGGDDDSSSSASEAPNAMTAALDREFQQQVHSLLESDEQLWKRNCLALASISSVIWCVPAEELAQLTLLGYTSDATPDRLLSALRNAQQFRDCKKASDRWRFVARSRNGAVTSNGILVRGSAGGTTSGHAIGTVYSLLGSRRKDPLEAMRDVDLRKRGRFVKGMFQGATAQCNLPLPTKIQLSQQNSSFLCFGFEPLSSMTFAKLQQITAGVERATREHKEVLAGYKGSGETVEVTSPLDTATYQNLRCVLHYMTICRCTLRFVRILAEQLKSEQQSFLAMFPQHWQSVSAIVSLDYLELGFSVLRAFLDCKDIRRREDVTNVVGYLAEILLLLNMLLQGDIAADPTVEVAAHALASSVLYKEDNIKVVFGLLSEYSSRVIAVRKAQVFTLFTFAVFQLMEKCSYKGNLLLPKRARRQKESAVVEAGEAADMGGVGLGDGDDNESVDSAALDNVQDEMLRDMADMIDDNGSDEEDEAEAVAQEKEAPDGVELFETKFEPLLGDASVDGGDAAASERAVSEGRPPSIASSGRTALSTLSSEREVAVGGFFQRLASPKNISLVYSALRHWRINDVDVNVAVTFLMDSLVRNNCESVFFNVAFLLVIREVLTGGEKTHAPLYAVCDRIVYSFFNPPLAKAQDARAAATFTSEAERGMLSGAQSYLGFEMALRCTRALFNFSTMDYTYLEEKGMAHLMSYTAIPLPGDGADAGVDGYDEALAAVSAASDSPAGKPRRPRRSAAAASHVALSEEKNSAPESEAEDDRAPLSRSESPAAEGSGKDKPKRAKRPRTRSPGEDEKKKRRQRKEAEATIADAANAGGVQQDEVAWSGGCADDATDSAAAAAMALAVAATAPFPGTMEETLVVEDAQ